MTLLISQKFNFFDTFLGTLSTHAILKGVGVGSDIVNPLSATVTWVNKLNKDHKEHRFQLNIFIYFFQF